VGRSKLEVVEQNERWRLERPWRPDRDRRSWRKTSARARLDAAAILIASSSLFGATMAMAEPATAVSVHERAVPRAVTGGALVFGVAYGLALYLPARDGFEQQRGWLAVPFVGPSLAMANEITDVSYWGLAFDQIGQLGGGALMMVGAINAGSHNVYVGTNGIGARARELRLAIEF
jgi:hypothetical protein